MTHTPNYGQSVKSRLLNLAKEENMKKAFSSICNIQYEEDGVHFLSDTLKAESIRVLLLIQI